MTFPTPTRLLVPLLALHASGAAAHTGHGHDGLDLSQGLLHALTEPDHLVMLAVGLGIVALATPPVLRGLRRLRALLRHRQARRLHAPHRG